MRENLSPGEINRGQNVILYLRILLCKLDVISIPESYFTSYAFLMKHSIEGKV